jgi:ATP-dependent Lhr-like helicase
VSDSHDGSSGLDALHEQLAGHIVNTLGWQSLREVQRASIAPIIQGDNVVILAPTAGGKTEASFFPLISQVLTHGWSGLSILYLSPIKALLNNQHERLERLFGMIGHRAELWHGDVGQSARRRIRKQPPTVLLTTPESLEAMLISTKSSAHAMFKDLRAVVIDEVHAFAGADRGWHLLGVLSRLAYYAGRDVQRIGLSATVGNTTEIVSWLSSGSQRAQTTVDPGPAPDALAPEVKLDWVATLDNAARVVMKLHAGKKRLVFCDSRIQAERLTRMLRASGVTTHITHSSLSAEERQRTETAFREGGPGVIVATSALELGVDIGELDHVLTIDAPMSVASFLQRMGRTGRRPGTRPNMIFLAVTEPGLLRATALLELWLRGYVEDVRPPALPYHILAQQLFAVVLETPGLTAGDLKARVATFLEATAIPEEAFWTLLEHLHEHDYFFQDGGRIGTGRRGEKELGHRHFMDVVSVFTSPPIFTVMHQRRELGSVHQSTFMRGESEPTAPVVILLAGRSWRVTSMSWSRKIVYVESFDMVGTTSWLGASPPMRSALAGMHQHVLTGHELKSEAHWSQRAHNALHEIQQGYTFLRTEGSTLASTAEGFELWNFAGTHHNRALADLIHQGGYDYPTVGALMISFKSHVDSEDLAMSVAELEDGTATLSVLPAKHESARSLKFGKLLPDVLLRDALSRRWYKE